LKRTEHFQTTQTKEVFTMSISTNQIFDQIESLDDDAQIEVLHWLWKKKSNVAEQHLDEVISLAEARSAEMNSGAVKGISWSEVQVQLDRLISE
jgi:hypothetical protein